MLKGKTIVMGVTGGIAAYKACAVVSFLRKQGASVFVIMTKNACEFVRPLTFETLSGHPVVRDMFVREQPWEVEHVSLAKRADLFLIAPATANIIAKIANGIADDMLTSTVLATKAPLLLAPAMNTGMWDAPATRQNIQTLLSRGVSLVGPEGGMLACGDSGVGRMSEPETIVAACVSHFTKAQDMAGLNVLVTAGPTCEPIDPVRYITNRSSGKMGFAIASAAQKRGANVTLVSGAVDLDVINGAALVRVTDTQSLYEAMMRLSPSQDIIIQAAAPADFKVREVSAQKIKKSGDAALTLQLVPNPDIAKAVGAMKTEKQTIVGFAAETENLIENARKKLESKHLDLVVANDVTQAGAGFDVDTNIVTLVTKQGEQALPMQTKAALGDIIIDRILEIRNQSM